LASQLTIADAWIGRDAFYEERVACRPRENDRFYQRLVRRYYSFLVPPGSNVLEMGCGLGDLLAEVKPAHGIGVDFSAKTIALARERHPEFEFHVGDAARWQRWGKESNREIREIREMGSDGAIYTFEYILLADLINDLPDVQAVFEHLGSLSGPRTRLVLNFLNTLWRPALAVAESLGAKAPSLVQNWLSTTDVKNLLHLAGWEVIKEEHRIVWPLRTPMLATLLNRWIAPFLADFCLTIFLVARPAPCSRGSRRISDLRDLKFETEKQALGRPEDIDTFKQLRDAAPEDWRTPSRTLPRKNTFESSDRISQALDSRAETSEGSRFTCSVIIPARNEAGNIEAAVLRTPELGLGTELIFVEGHSADDTWEEIQRVARKYPHRNIKIRKQESKGKGGAVREGFAAATGDLLFILDADLTMPPEELTKFYEVARSGTAEFINGVRLVYPMEHEAMRFLNMVANKVFGVAFSWLLGQQLKDTLCGTKVLFRSDYERLAQNRGYFGEFDPFGDFDLLFGAAKLNLRMIDLPIRYRARTYGETNIRRWRHGWLLLRMVVFAARRLKFL
jgi:SAM-dependent methyltransferase